MGYFSDHYNTLRLPVGDVRTAGFRLAQIAAIHSVSAHFFNSDQPAIVTMPTGSGKTTVLMALAFVLRAQRVLILTPSRLVREQIAENFAVLLDLKKIEALPLGLQNPRVFATEGIIDSAEEWEELRQYDVVVATVPSVSPRDDVIPAPPDDLFDLVLVDEAHHSPARTWSRLLGLLHRAKQVLFTATPFRRDEKEIKGRLVFTYDLRRASQDGVFGDITFLPVELGNAPSIDVAIALATQAKLKEDQAAGLQHLVMVRADTVARAKELKSTYDDNTGLRLAFVQGSHTLAHVRGIIAKLRAFELDGIVCVNMFGEGFNLPNLKIAAIHSPHKSLAITLQFIGRFARTNREHIGGATFLAEPTNSSEELEDLYEAGAVWRDIVQNLAASRIEAVARTREVIDSFAIDAAPDMEDFSLYTVQPYFHVKIFSVTDGADVNAEPKFPGKMQIIFRGVSDPHGAAVYLTREAVRADWSGDERFVNIAYDIFVFYHDVNSRLLFICSSRRQNELYHRLARQIANRRPRPLPNTRINRVLNDLQNAEFFNVGMRKRNQLGQTESYRTLVGPIADKAVQPTDARTFDRGHCFGKAMENGDTVTIGLSAGSKVWSNRYDRIPELLDWCNRLANRISSQNLQPTGSGLDLLSTGDELTEVPAGIIAVSWAADLYQDPLMVRYENADGEMLTGSLMDFDFKIIESQQGRLTFSITNSEIEWQGQFSLAGGEMFQAASDHEPDIAIHYGSEKISVDEYLNETPPIMYRSDLSVVQGLNSYPIPLALEPFPNGAFEVVDWRAANVEITSEKLPEGAGQSIFQWLRARLVASDAAVVFCDDGSCEMADFIAISATPQGPRVDMYHCKASGGDNAGNRVEDLEEVCAQAIKSCVWLLPDQFLNRLRYRRTLASIPGYQKGTEADAVRILTERPQQIQFRVHIVQPGVVREGRTDAVSNLLAAARNYLIGGVNDFRIIGSGQVG